MHFIKAVTLFAGIAAAAPASFTTPFQTSPSLVTAGKASSSPAVAAQKVPSSTMVTAIKADIANFDDSMAKAITALNGFTGGAKIADQATTVSKAGDVWQAAAVKLINTSSSLDGYGQFTTTDSATLAKAMSGSLATNAVKLFKLIKDKKALFAQTNAVKSVHDGLMGIQAEIAEVGQNIEPHLRSSDLATMEPAGKNIFAASNNAINAYAS
jgi:hypothetical protein